MSDRASAPLMESKENSSGGAASEKNAEVAIEIKDDEQPGLDVNSLVSYIPGYSGIDFSMDDGQKQITMVRTGIFSRMGSVKKTVWDSYETDVYKFLSKGSNFVAMIAIYGLFGYIAASVMNWYAAYNAEEYDPKHLLAPKGLVYAAAAVYSFAKFIEAVFAFVSSKDDAKVIGKINGAWGQIQVFHKQKYKKNLPDLIINEFDSPRFAQGVLGIVVFVAGIALVIKNVLAPGLGLVLVGSLLLAWACTGFAESQIIMTESGYRVVYEIFFRRFSKVIGDEQYVDLQKDLKELDSIIVKMKNKGHLF